MSDLLVNLAEKKLTAKVLRTIGIRTPPVLRRSMDEGAVHPLANRSVMLGGSGLDDDNLSTVLTEAGAEVLAAHSDEPNPIDGLIFDATGLDTIGALRYLYDFFHPKMTRLNRCCRVVVIGRSDEVHPQACAVQAALLGFTKSLAKELGRKGSTANMLRIGPGGEDHIAGPLRYLLSDESAFISGQALAVGGCDSSSPASWAQPFSGKTVLVTGAARGIGRATVIRMAAEGARVLCLDIASQSHALTDLADEVGGVAVPADITDSDVSDVILASANGPIDVLVHNAGITRDRTLGRMDELQWDLTLSVNLQAVYDVTVGLQANGGLQPGGRVVLVSSVAGIAGNVGQTNYAASKAGILGLVNGLSAAFSDSDIAVNAVAPGFIETQMTAAIPFVIRQFGRRLSNLSQGGVPDDVARAISFLASPSAVGVRGSVLRVCGGSLIGA